MRTASKSDIGRIRSINQDTILADPGRGIFLLADGLGGHNAGEVASAVAVKEAHDFLLRTLVLSSDDADPSVALGEALCRAHDAIRRMADSDIRYHGMGTTLVELYIRDAAAYICHAGDSRAYLYRSGLERLTRDHTVGNSLENPFKEGKVPPQMKHILTQAVGINECPVPDIRSVMFGPGDVLILCSDGLTNMLTDEEIGDMIGRHRTSLESMVDALVAEANSRGGVDNISLIAVEKEHL